MGCQGGAQHPNAHDEHAKAEQGNATSHPGEVSALIGQVVADAVGIAMVPHRHWRGLGAPAGLLGGRLSQRVLFPVGHQLLLAEGGQGRQIGAFCKGHQGKEEARELVARRRKAGGDHGL